MRTSIVSWLVGSVAVLAGVSAFSCRGLDSDSLVDCEEARTCQSGTSAGDGGSDANVVVPAGCDLAKSPKDAPSCVDDGVGVFVSPTGSDGAAGTKSAPVKSVGKGVELAGAKGLPRVYVCEGTYDANVEIKSAVSVHGGLSCAWAYTGTKPKIAPPKGVALKVTKVTGAVVLEDLEVVGSADASVPGDSAIAVFVSESTDVTLRRVQGNAGAGTAGGKGSSVSNYSGASAYGGGNANGGTAGAGIACTCTSAGSSKGGNGATPNAQTATDGTATPAVGAPNGGLSGSSTCTDGTVGANGAANLAGVGAGNPGALLASGWDGKSKASSAPSGNPGQGGGGGGAKTAANSAGGGGGCGGCGGGGGEAGPNGGVSVALLSFNSTVAVEAGALVSAVAGVGGAGGEGQAGQAGGSLGAGACNGGAGGAGAGGSGGAGGAGGHSVPIVFTGTEPKVTGTTLTPGIAGKGGAGGAGGKGPGNAGPDGPAGVDGKSQPTLSL